MNNDDLLDTDVTSPGEGAEEGSYRISPDIVHEVEAALDRDRPVDRLIAPLHAADVADLFEDLSGDNRRRLAHALRGRLDPEILTNLDEAVRTEIVEVLGSTELASAITELESDDALDVIEDLEDDDRAAVLRQLSPSDRALIEEALSWPEESAGRLMQRDLVTVPSDWSVGGTIDYMRARAAHLPRDFYDIYVVDEARRPVGFVPLSRLMRSRRPVAVSDIMQTEMHAIPLEMDQEDVALFFRQYAMVSAPVLDSEGQLVGVITIDDIVDVIHDEHEEDLMHLGGVAVDDFYRDILDTTRSRFSWLLVNLGTAIIASIAISFFDAAIEQIVALAILMPIVASMGGNAGTQTMTVAVRAMAMKELTPANAMRIIGKEVVVGGINGVLFALLAGMIAWVWFGNPALGAIIGLAMIINLAAAAFTGVAVPVLLDRAGIDPAIASAVILTTVTDVIGFVAFLGLAAVTLL